MKKTRTPEMKAAYDREYIRQNLTMINITFNRKKPEDIAMMEWLNRVEGSRAAYVKRLIREDMEKGGD